MKKISSVRNEEKVMLFKQDSLNPKLLQFKVKELFYSSFEECLNQILILNEKNFIRAVADKSTLQLELEYSDVCFKSSIIKDQISKNREAVYSNVYLSAVNLLRVSWDEFSANINALKNFNTRLSKKNVDNLSYLEHFIPHCTNTNKVGLHLCGSKLIEVFDQKSSIVIYLICIGCKWVYKSNCIKLLCGPCNVHYFTKYLTELERKEDLVPATWEKYHCNNILNDCMRCLKCNDTFYLNKKNALLNCKKCSFQIKPMNIAWQCLICKIEFKSQAKQYDAIEFKIVRDSIKTSIECREPAIPESIPCCKNAIPKEFFHKKECYGLLYRGLLFDRLIVTCEKCKAMNYYDNFIWTCPFCFKRFRNKNKETISASIEVTDPSRKLVVQKPISLIKNIAANELKEIIKKDSNRPASLETISDSSAFYYNCNEEHSRNNADPNDRITNLHKSSIIFTSGDSKGTSKLNFKPKNLIDILDSRRHQRMIDIRSSSSGGTLSSSNQSVNNKFCKIQIDVDGIVQVPALYNSANKEIKTKSIFKNIQSPEQEECSKFDSKIATPKQKIKESPNKIPDLKLKHEVNKSMLLKEESKNVCEKKHIETFNLNLEEDKLMIDTANNSISMIKSELPNRKFVLKPTPKAISTYSSILQDQSVERKIFNINDYKIVQQIGEGSFGKIYKVTDKKGNKFALKKIICHKLSQLKLTKNEFSLVSANAHPNIIRIEGMIERELDETTFALYILLELADSDWEKEIINRFKKMKYYKESELIAILTQLALSLAFLQRKKIAHRDIKPQNILLFNNSSVFKIADFGEAKQNTINRQTNTLKGTELYMSPILFGKLKHETCGKPSEINLQDVKHNVYKSDIFSLGYCMIYAATLTFDAIYAMREVEEKKEIELIIHKHLGKRYSDRFINLLLRMIDLDESNRFDLIELSNHLEKYWSK